MSSPPVHLYIYYRIAEMHAAEARTALTSVMKALEKQFAIRGRLLCAQDDAALWMEVYENVGEPMDFEAALDALLARTDFASWLAADASRRTERFVGPAP